MCEITLRELVRLTTAAKWYDNVMTAMRNRERDFFSTADCFPEADMTTTVDGDIIITTDVNAVLVLSETAAKMAMIKIFCDDHNNYVLVDEIEPLLKGV